MNFWIKLNFQTKKNENYHQILYVHINLDSKFQHQQTICIFGTNFKKNILPVENTKNEHAIAIFWTKFSKKGSYFQSKTDKIDTTIEFCIFELVFVSNFTLKNLKFLDQIFPRKIFMVKNRKSEHHL